MTLHDWAQRHAVSPQALAELAALTEAAALSDTKPGSEQAASNAIRVAASQRGDCLFRNNVGALLDPRGVPVRYGLANDSKQLNAMLKSADLIGIRRLLITPAHVGQHVGQFMSIEVKRPGWRFTGAGREAAQQAWAMRVTAFGGVACFATGPEGLP